jgi:thymidylate kinase
MNGRRIVVGFTGLDGTGKSTQALELERRLRESGYYTVKEHHYSPVTTLGRFLKRHFRQTIERLQRRVARPGTAIANTAQVALPRTSSEAYKPSVFAQITATWALLGGWWRATWRTRLHSSVDVLILDRTFIDEIVRVEWKFQCGARLGRWLLKRVPKPDLVIELRNEAETGWHRKKLKNMAREEYDRKRRVMEEVMAQVRCVWPAHSIDSGREAADVADDVYARVVGLWMVS